MPTDGERLATVEALLGEVKADVGELRAEELRTRTRLHNLEGFAQAYLDTQKVHRRQEERQYRRLSHAISLGGLAMTVALVVLAIVTLITHAG